MYNFKKPTMLQLSNLFAFSVWHYLNQLLIKDLNIFLHRISKECFITCFLFYIMEYWAEEQDHRWFSFPNSVFKKRVRKFLIISKANRISELVINCDVWGFVNIKFLLIIKFKSTLNYFSHRLLPISFLNVWPILVSELACFLFFSLRLCWQFWQLPTVS